MDQTVPETTNVDDATIVSVQSPADTLIEALEAFAGAVEAHLQSAAMLTIQGSPLKPQRLMVEINNLSLYDTVVVLGALRQNEQVIGTFAWAVDQHRLLALAPGATTYRESRPDCIRNHEHVMTLTEVVLAHTRQITPAT